MTEIHTMAPGTKLDIIRKTLLVEMGQHMAYPSWTPEFRAERVDTLQKRTLEMIGGTFSLYELTAKEMLRAGFLWWTTPHELLLIPIWMYRFLHPGDRLVRITGIEVVVGKTYWVRDTEGYIDNDHRYGCLAVGVSR